MLTGNFINNITEGNTFKDNTSLIEFVGSELQTIKGTANKSVNYLNFPSLRINNPASVHLSPSMGMEVMNLDLQKGRLVLESVENSLNTNTTYIAHLLIKSDGSINYNLAPSYIDEKGIVEVQLTLGNNHLDKKIIGSTPPFKRICADYFMFNFLSCPSPAGLFGDSNRLIEGPLSINVISTAGTYIIDHGTAFINDTYTVGVPLNSTNTISIPTNICILGSWKIVTDIVDGISFFESGVFTATGAQFLSIAGTGTPTSTQPKVLELRSNSQGQVSSSCYVSATMTMPSKTILALGFDDYYGYKVSKANSGVNLMLTSDANFGTSSSSTFKTTAIQFIDGRSAPSNIVLQNYLTITKVDIVVIGYSYNISTTQATFFSNYLNAGGVLIALCQDATSDQLLLRAAFNDPSITIAADKRNGGDCYQLPNFDNPILNGPFGDIRGKCIGEDPSRADVISLRTVPLTYLNWYYTDYNYAVATSIDDGIVSNPTSVPLTISTGTYTSIDNTNYGNGGSSYYQTVVNSKFIANAIAWVLQQAEFNGINSQSRLSKMNKLRESGYILIRYPGSNSLQIV